MAAYEGAAVLFSSLRIAPTLAFAPPFSLVRIPTLFKVFLAFGLTAAIASFSPPASRLSDSAALIDAIAQEVFLGLLIAWSFHAAFAGLQIVGRTLDIQSGQGFSTILDPTTHASTPLTGQIFALAAAASFFAADGHLTLVRLFAASFEVLPFGANYLHISLPHVASSLSQFIFFAFSFGAAPLLALFLSDCAIALLSRTAPQINPLVLGLQIKSIVLLLSLPLSFSMATALYGRFNNLLFDDIATLFGD